MELVVAVASGRGVQKVLEQTPFITAFYYHSHSPHAMKIKLHVLLIPTHDLILVSLTFGINISWHSLL